MAETTTLKKTAYVAVGLPSRLVKKVRQGVSSLTEASGSSRERLMIQLREIVDEWTEEGERVTASIAGKVRSRADTATDRVSMAGDVTRGIAATVSHPPVLVEQIAGVGPGYSHDLVAAGIATTSALVERCDSPEAIERLAEQTGISALLIESWVADADLTRIEGIGSAYANMLNALGSGSISHLAERDAAELRMMALELDDPELGAIPSEQTFADWITRAQEDLLARGRR